MPDTAVSLCFTEWECKSCGNKGYLSPSLNIFFQKRCSGAGTVNRDLGVEPAQVPFLQHPATSAIMV